MLYKLTAARTLFEEQECLEYKDRLELIPRGTIVMMLTEPIVEKSDLDNWCRVRILCPSFNVGWIIIHDISADCVLELIE